MDGVWSNMLLLQALKEKHSSMQPIWHGIVEQLNPNRHRL